MTSQLEKRLVARSGTDEWYKARELGVSATTVAKAASGPGGYKAELDRALHPEDNIVEDNAYMRFGRDYEEWIVDNLPHEYGIKHNDWLIASENEPHHLATPDGLNADWSIIAEVKTTGKDWSIEEKPTTAAAIPIQYRRQVQWQLYVTGAQRCVFAWLLRAESPFTGDFVPAWLEPKHIIIERNEEMIADLIDVAHRFVEDYNNHKEWETM